MDKDLKYLLDESKLDQLYKNNLFSVKAMSQLLGTWDNYTTDEQFQLENLTERDSHINKNYRYKGKYDKKLVYGEITRKGVETLIEKINRHQKVNDKDVFIDVGCGTGKLLMHLSIRTNFKTLIGVEIQKERLEYGKYIKDKLFNDTPVFLFNKDIFNFDLSIGTVFFMNDVCFDDNMSQKIYDKLPNGSHFITYKNRPECKILKEEIYLDTSWSKNPVKFNYYMKYT